MQLIEVAPPRPVATSTPPAHASLQAIGGLIDAIGRPDFARAGLAALNRCLVAGWWSVYRLYEGAPPRLHANASLGVPDGTDAAWRVYRESLYPYDDSFAQVRGCIDGERIAKVSSTPASPPAFP